MKNKKYLSLLLLALTTISLASCGNTNTPTILTNSKYILTLEPNKTFLKSEKQSLKKLANGEVKEVVDYEFVVPEKEISVTNYNDLLIGANPLLLTPIAIEMNDETVVRTLTAEETKSEFNPITEFSKSGYGDANIDSSLYNTEQLRTCYSISQSESGTLQSKYYNVSIVIEDNEAPVLNQAGVAELPFTLDIDSIKLSLKESIHSSLTDNNSNTTLTVTLKDEPILTGLTNLNKEQVIHFDATDSDENKIENQAFKYKLVDTLNYFENIDQTTVTDISYKSANIDYITNSFSLYSDIYSYKLLNKDELVTNEGTITEELKEVVNKEQTAKYAVYEKDALVGEFGYKFKIIDDVMPELYLKGSDELAYETMQKRVEGPCNEYRTAQIKDINRIINWFDKYFERRDDFGVSNYYFKLIIDEHDSQFQLIYFESEDINRNHYVYPLNLMNYYYNLEKGNTSFYSLVQDGLYDSNGIIIE